MKINKISKNIYEIPKNEKMLVPGRIFVSEKIKLEEKAIEQVSNIAKLPGILKYSIGLTDIHTGYGFPIGGVAAFDIKKGVVSPAGVGYDINCSVRLLKTNLKKKDILNNSSKITELIYKKIPSGLGKKSNFKISRKDFEGILEKGAKYLVNKGFGKKEDYLNTEEKGGLNYANIKKISEESIKRGIKQLGTIGAGNHFLEIGFVEKIFDENIAKIFGLKKNQVTIMIHCGSRGLGHQIASDYIDKIKKEIKEDFPNSELVYAPLQSEIGKDYISAMACATNFSFANKQLITHWLREELSKIFPKIKIDVLYEVCHNIAKFENHIIDGKNKKIFICRKGSTRSFGPNRKEIPLVYRKVGQPVIIPGSMGTSSYVLCGTKKSEEITFGSTVHGAGRLKSRHQAKKLYSDNLVKNKLLKKGIIIKGRDKNCLSEEAPEAYKDVEEVVKVVSELGLSKKVARLKPLIVLK
jgi:tRNA-splicing ligase RtcB (3'-phosphate/5'-hydroxy nucleic acid ligase)